MYELLRQSKFLYIGFDNPTIGIRHSLTLVDSDDQLSWRVDRPRQIPSRTIMTVITI